MSRRLQSVQIKNVKGISSLTLQAGAVTVIAGENGAGKSSVIDAIDCVFTGGHDPALIRHGADKAEVLLTLDDGVTIRKRITPKDSTLEVRTEDGGIVKAPANYVKRLADSFAFDPIGLLEAKPKERAAWLLRHGGITFSADEVNAAVGVPVVRQSIDLERLEAIRAGKYIERTDVNRRLRDLQGAISEQKAMLPPAMEKDWAAEQERIETDISIVRHQVQAAKDDLSKAVDNEKQQKRAAAQAEIDAIKDRLSRELAEIDTKARAVEAEETAPLNQAIIDLSAELAGARAKADEQKRAAGVKAVIERNQIQYQEQLALEGSLNRTLKALDQLKLSKLAEIPIPDLDIKDGEILIAGVPFDHLNTQAQMYAVIRAAKLALGELPLMVIDRAESLDEERFAELSEAVAEAGLQMIAARVTEGPLKVEVAAQGSIAGAKVPAP